MPKVTKATDVAGLPRYWIRVHLDTTTLDLFQDDPKLIGNAQLIAREIAQAGTGRDLMFYPAHRIVKVELIEAVKA